jgi:hypothetical protein
MHNGCMTGGQYIFPQEQILSDKQESRVSIYNYSTISPCVHKIANALTDTSISLFTLSHSLIHLTDYESASLKSTLQCSALANTLHPLQGITEKKKNQ